MSDEVVQLSDRLRKLLRLSRRRDLADRGALVLVPRERFPFLSHRTMAEVMADEAGSNPPAAA